MNMQTTHAYSAVSGTTPRGNRSAAARRWPLPSAARPATTHSLPKPTAAPKLTAAENLMIEEGSGEQRLRAGSGPVV
jgi:hypothetical protein